MRFCSESAKGRRRCPFAPGTAGSVYRCTEVSTTVQLTVNGPLGDQSISSIKPRRTSFVLQVAAIPVRGFLG